MIMHVIVLGSLAVDSHSTAAAMWAVFGLARSAPLVVASHCVRRPAIAGDPHASVTCAQELRRRAGGLIAAQPVLLALLVGALLAGRS